MLRNQIVAGVYETFFLTGYFFFWIIGGPACLRPDPILATTN